LPAEKQSPSLPVIGAADERPLFRLQAAMALSAATVWEVRTDGNDTNGGAFVTGASGTDWSQQAAAQYSVTDAVTDGTTTITSATANFGTDVVGNLLYITGGTGSIAASRYQITARNSASSITVDRSTGLSAGTGATLKIGGALATPGGQLGQVVGENIVFIKYNATAIALTTASENVAGGPFSCASSLSDIRVIGYDTTRTVANTDANRPTVKAGANSTAIFTVSGGSTRGVIARNLIAHANAFTSCTGFRDNGVDRELVENCKAIDCATGFAFTGGITCLVINCESTGHTTAGFSGGSMLIGCYAHDGTAVGFTGSDCRFCIADSNSGASTDGFVSSAFGNNFVGCTSYNSGRHGFNLSATTGRAARGVGLLAYGNGGYGFECGAATVLRNHAAGSNTSGNVNGSPIQLTTLVALTADPFTNGAGGNFALNSTAGGGAACRAAGFPGAFPGGTTTGYQDIGAAQHQDAGGSGGGPLVIPCPE
jgi:hypothetical protein